MKKKIGTSKSIKKYGTGGENGPGDGIMNKVKKAGRGIEKALDYSNPAKVARGAASKIYNAIPSDVKQGIKKGVGAVRKLTGLKKGGSVKSKKK